jgi:hypothetical protein
LTFVLADVINEFYGTEGARRITYLGLGTAIFAFVIVNVALALPPSTKGLPDEVFRNVFGWSRRLCVASLVAYLLGQLADITTFALFRRLTRHRLLWLRATGSTVVSQALDTAVVNFVLLTGRESLGAITRIAVHSYLAKPAGRHRADAGHLCHPRPGAPGAEAAGAGGPRPAHALSAPGGLANGLRWVN